MTHENRRIDISAAFVAALTLAMLVFCVSASSQQQPIQQSWTETITLAPPAVLNSQSFSTSTATGVSVSSTGGTIAAGAYRICVTFFTATNTETPCSTDTAATSVVTFTGATSTLTIQPPIAVGTGGNVVGWRMYIGANAGASAAETLQTITGTVCSLSSSSTPSCALTSPAVFTASTNFSGGGGGPATPGTAIFPQLANQANQAVFENASMTYRAVNWIVTGTAPGACTLNIQTGATVAGLANGGQTITCTATGGYSLPSAATANFSSINLATYTAGDTTTKVQFFYWTLPFNPNGPYYYGNAVPTGTCPTGGVFMNTAGGVSTTLYTCNAGTWTAVTVP